VKYYTNKARQAGMTLIELTVVLLVLVGLAGLLIPYVQGFVTKTHDSTGSSNIQALDNAMARYGVEHYDNYPDKMDSLLNATNGVYLKMMSSIMPAMSGNYLLPLQLDAGKASALSGIGINTVMVMNDLTTDATFANTDSTFPNGVTLGAGKYVAELGNGVLGSLHEKLGRPVDTENYHYIVMGVGDDSTIVGQTVTQVPVHFAADGDMGANNAYNHFVAVFEVLKQDACLIPTSSTWAPVYTPVIELAGANIDYVDGATADSGGLVAAPTVAEMASAATQAACLALNTAAQETSISWTGNGATADSESGTGTWDYTGVEWKTAGTDKAKFMGTAMAMGMNNFEGLGGAMTRYYKNSAQN